MERVSNSKYRGMVVIDFDEDHKKIEFEGSFEIICLGMAAVIHEMAKGSNGQVTEADAISEIRRGLEFIRKMECAEGAPVKSSRITDEMKEEIKSAVSSVLKKGLGPDAEVVAVEDIASIARKRGKTNAD